MTVRDWTKLIVCVLVVGAASFLTYTEKIPAEAGVGLITAVLGYVFGNGHGIYEQRKDNKGSGMVNGKAKVDE
jgi:uncharacterized membrane protein YGL010W